MSGQFGTDAFFITKDGQSYPRNLQYPIIILSADTKQLAPLAAKVRAAQAVEGTHFIRKMIEVTDDEEMRQLAAKGSDDIKYLGVGMFGKGEQLKALPKALDCGRNDYAY
ncbi:MAG TPA: DUF2000 family protein [Candidatus Saccharimonadales bacterium]|nr:DUF2000 family protein [Candidatus Saccharimonadales bacterium]